MYLHGGPTATQGDWWYPEIPAVAIAGFHVFAPNFRGSDGFGKDFRDLNIGDLGGGDLQDVRYSARYAMQVIKTDHRPALFGRSYGGYLTLQGLVTQPDEWAGGVAIAPTTDWKEDYSLSDSHYRKFCSHFFGGTPAEKSDLYSDMSPITHLKRLTRPLLILHGENDMITSLEPVKKFSASAENFLTGSREVIISFSPWSINSGLVSLLRCVIGDISLYKSDFSAGVPPKKWLQNFR